MNEEYIKERMKDYAMNIDDFSIGQEITDLDKSIGRIINKTSNSIEVLIKRKSKDGTDCNQWFNMMGFNKRFK